MAHKCITCAFAYTKCNFPQWALNTIADVLFVVDTGISEGKTVSFKPHFEVQDCPDYKGGLTCENHWLM